MTTPAGLQWGYKFVGTDLSTNDHQGGRFRYRLGEWHEAANPTVHDNPCPRTPGDGLCVARTLSGAQSGGLRLGRSVMLLVGFTAADVLTEASDKVRVARLWVHPDPVDPVRVIIEPGADLRDADLRDADLRGANLRGADLRRADLGGADLRGADLQDADFGGANLWGANLWRADLRDADLRDADLRRADLRGADLYGAHGIPASVLPAGCRKPPRRGAALKDIDDE